MNAFVRQLAVLSTLWAVCELLLPDNRLQFARLTVSALVMTALLSTAGQWLSVAADETAAAAHAAQRFESSYLRAALTASANQSKAYCEAIARRAGYEAQAVVTLRADGGAERIEMWLTPVAPLLSGDALRQKLCESFGVDAERIWLWMSGDEGT